MPRWAVAGSTLRLQADGEQVLSLPTRGLNDTATDDAADAELRCVLAAIDLPCGPAAIRDGTSGAIVDCPPGSELELDRNAHRVIIRTNGDRFTSVAFDAAARVGRTEEGPLQIRFQDPAPVQLEHHQAVQQPVELPATPGGLAAAVTYAGCRHPTATVGRSLPALRAAPPPFSIDETASTPSADWDHKEVLGPTASAPQSPELIVPETFEAVYAAAPLAFYLGATLEARSEAVPAIRVDGSEIDLEPIVDRAPATLERMLWLDVLVREAGSPDPPPRVDRLQDLDLEPGQLRECQPGRRLAAYDGVSTEDLSLPSWHLVSYVAPDPENVAAVPGLLDRLSHMVPPTAHELSGRELMERTLDDFFRDGGAVGGGARTPVDVVDPELRDGHLHGWLADGTPLDVFKAVPRVFAGPNHERPGPYTVAVVHNEADMAPEGDAVARTYRDTIEGTVTVERNLTTAALRETFERGVDLLHFIGHCDAEGLRCPDGNLSVADIDGPLPTAAFLNACGSYFEGAALVEGGAQAVGVTFRKVLDQQARTVGTNFARLFAEGFPIDRALALARRQIVMGKDYAVVGDGTHTLVEPEPRVPTAVDLEKLADGYRVTPLAPGVPGPGGTYRALEPPGGRRLRGDESATIQDRSTVLEVLRSGDRPVTCDGELWRSRELATHIDADSG